MFKMFGKKLKVNFNDNAAPVDTTHLDESLKLLRSTTLEVGQAAIEAARTLECQLVDTQSRFYSTIDAINDLVIIKDGEGRWQTLNRCGQDLFGWHHGEYAGKTNLELHSTHPRFAQVMSVCDGSDNTAWNKGEPHRCVETFYRANEELQLDVVKTPVFNPDGSRKELIIVGRDVTESINRSKRMKACFTALNSASDIIVIVDRDEHVFFCNDQFLRVFGHKEYDEVVGDHISNVLPSIANYDTMWYNVRENRIWKDTYKSNFDLNVLPMMNGAPEPIYYVFTLKQAIQFHKYY